MSIWSDYEAEMTFRMHYPHGVNNDEWTTREGKTLKLKDMTTAHIKNCMRMIGDTNDFYYAFEAELARRGEKLEDKMAEFQEVMNHARRMCSVTACSICGLRGDETHCKINHAPIAHDEDTLKEIEEAVMNWAMKNPAPRYPTYREHVLEAFPTLNPMYIFGRCLCDLYGTDARPSKCYTTGHHDISCSSCWDREMSAKIAKKLGAEKKQHLEE